VSQVDAGDVEAWVVKGIARGLLDARMDQAQRTVTVLRTVQREFGPAHWTILQSKLRQWRDNVGALLATVEGVGSGGGGGGGRGSNQ
jgi:hypothetical protein